MTISKEEFSIIVPEYGMNKITNPVPYQSTTGFNYTNGTMSIDSTYTRRGPACLKMVPTSGQNSTIYFSPLSVTSGQPYTFSVDIKGYAGQAMRIMIQNGSGTMQAQKTFTATGNWQRVSVTLTSAGATATNWRAVVQRDSVASTQPFWADGWQFENKAYATTFIYGDEKGLGYIDREYYWAGSPFASASVRSANTRHGGKLVKINDYAIINKVIGLGMGKFESHVSELAMGGSVLQSTIRQPRPFSFLLTFKGNSQDAIYANRQVIIDAIRPDRDNQPLILHYQGFDSSGNEVTQPIDIICKAEVSLQDTPNLPTRHTDLLSFTALDTTLDGAYYEGSYLLYSEELNTNYIVRQKPNGEWDTMGTGLQGGYAVVFAEAPNGDMYIGGSFTSAGGVANTSKLARWSKSAQSWQSVLSIPPNNDVMALKFDSNGDLYVGGMFTSIGGNSNAKYLAKITDLSGTPFIFEFGATVDDYVYAIEIDFNGIVYVGGRFKSIGGISVGGAAYYDTSWHTIPFPISATIRAIKTNYQGSKVVFGGSIGGITSLNVVAWDGTSLIPLGTGLNNIVRDLMSYYGGNLIAVGQFTNVGGSKNKYIAHFNGSTWDSLPFGSPDNAVYSITKRVSYRKNLNYFYICGAFTSVGNINLSDRVAGFDQSSWKTIGIDLPGTGIIYCVYASSDGSLYISGDFSGTTMVDGITIDNVINGSSAASAYPIIQIKGPGTLLSIENKTTGKKIDFNNLTLQPNEYINLWLDPHNLKFESSWEDRECVLDYITAGSDISDFNLAPGINNISVYMPTGTTSATNAWIRWKPKFWSLDGAVL